MKQSKFLTSLCIAALSIQLCSCQNKTDNKQETNMKIHTINLNLDSLLTTYKSQPVYYARYGNAGCLFEIRINDNYTDKLTENANIGSTVSTINTKILRSGKNTVYVKLLPPVGETMITNSEPFHLEIGYKDFSLPQGERPWTWILEMPAVIVPEQGLPYYEYTAEFEAEVPYQITGWSDCIDLRQIPDIEERVVAEFKRIRQMMVERRFDDMKVHQNFKNYDLAVALYQSTEAMEESWNRYVNGIQDNNVEGFQPIEDYELVFYADGRLVTLESKKEGGYPSALLWLKDTEETLFYHYFDMRLGIRQGTNELIPIR